MDIEKRLADLRNKHGKDYKELFFELAREKYGQNFENFPEMEFRDERIECVRSYEALGFKKYRAINVLENSFLEDIPYALRDELTHKFLIFSQHGLHLYGVDYHYPSFPSLTKAEEAPDNIYFDIADVFISVLR